MTTKKEEREALVKIREILNRLGADSYVATAFEGCLEIAESNIDDDLACSMKQRAESAEEKLEEAERTLKLNDVELASLRTALVKAESRILSADDVQSIGYLLGNCAVEAEEKAAKAAQDIIRYADDPDSEEFRTAVRINRSSAQTVENCKALAERLYATRV